MAQRVARAYRMVSTKPALVVAGLIPIHHLALEQANKHKARAQEFNYDAEEDRKETFRKWQAKWESAGNGAWTRW